MADCLSNGEAAFRVCVECEMRMITPSRVARRSFLIRCCVNVVTFFGPGEGTVAASGDNSRTGSEASSVRTGQWGSPIDEGFEEWTKEEEIRTKSSFVKRGGAKKVTNKQFTYYMCHRSGISIIKSERKRNEKIGGSIKCGKTCSAFMTSIREQQEVIKITVEYQSVQASGMEFTEFLSQKRDVPPHQN
ncbi:hypothetical protein TNCV_967401 [Trichonephila clavipes]|nr:hypothetical protein TNCV_967401 [Trichonephila clavipes]